MKAILSGLAIVALIATTHADEEKGDMVWLGPKHSNPIPVKGINDDNSFVEMEYRPDDNALILLPILVKAPQNTELHPECGIFLGLQINTEKPETFCNLAILGVKKQSDGSVRMVMRFGNSAEKQCRLEIPISDLPEEEKSEKYQENPENKFIFIDANRFENMRQKKPFWFEFTWLTELLKYGVESASANPIEAESEGVKTFVSRPIRLSPEAMDKLRKVVV